MSNPSVSGFDGEKAPSASTMKLTPTSIAIDRSGTVAYIANSGSKNISMYSINSTTGTLSLIGTLVP